jgi:TolA-binding protein
MSGLLRARALVATLAGATALAGCVTRAQFEQLEQESRAREERLAAIEAQLSHQSQGLEEASALAQERVQELRAILEQATQAVTRNSADLGTEVVELREKLGALEGQLAEIRNELGTGRAGLQQRIDELAQQLQRVASDTGVDLSLPESEIPAEPSAHFQAGRDAFERRDYSRARSLFRVFVNRYPQNAKADDALYYIGASYMQEDRPQSAIPSFQKIIQDYRSGDMVDDTLLQMGEAFFALHACEEAKTAYEALLSGHRSSPLAARARQGLSRVRSATRAQCTAP